MHLGDIEQNVAALNVDQGFDLIYDLLRAYGIPQASISRLKTGTYNQSKREDDRLWKGKVYYRFLTNGEDPHVVIDEAVADDAITAQKPRFLIISTSDRLLAVDSKTHSTLDIELAELAAHTDFFLPWAGLEKTQLENLNYADIKAAEKMARLYDEIVKDERNDFDTESGVRQLNVFFSRLLFCFFAEDTGVFPAGLFTNTLASMTQADGSDTNRFLDDLFVAFNTPTAERISPHAFLRDFGYVNGTLFANSAPAPSFSAKARRLIIECGTLDWSLINPDIFGSMIQAVVHPGYRDSLGMHYTSVENIMKVIRPLFLDELQDAFEGANAVAQLERLLRRLSNVVVFDPACGSGNFLVISYKELRKLEHRILQRIEELDPAKGGMFTLSRIKLENFHGIEIDDFAHEIATLSLWLAKHQMNVEFTALFNVEIPLIPLREAGNIVHGNSARMDWDEVCPSPSDGEVRLLGNPPYQGGTRQTDEQKEDLVIAFDDPNVHKYLDYVSIWFYKGARYVVEHDAELGFVTTNSICQGNHVGLLWPRIKALGADISFAHSAFRWSNNAKGNAGVTCVIVGLSRPRPGKQKAYYTDGMRRQVRHINSYLVPDGEDVIVTATDKRTNGFPKMAFGSMPRDSGHLIISTGEERAAIIRESPAAAEFIKPYIGADEFIKGSQRFCIWVPSSRVEEAYAIPALAERFELVRQFRAHSKADSTRKAAKTPHRFVQIAHLETDAIIVPIHSSERRQYIPMGFLGPDSVISNAANAIYGAQPWLFGLIQSRMHMAWARAVGGGLEERIRYASTLCYNTFPVPDLSDADKEALTEHVLVVLEARERHSDRALANLYDPDGMPADLARAHEELDRAVDVIYRPRPFSSDEERLKHLFEMYMQAGNED